MGARAVVDIDIHNTEVALPPQILLGLIRDDIN